jgi:hypothetical protein
MNKIFAIMIFVITSVFVILASYIRSEACSRSRPINVRETCSMAGYIVRATAIEYLQPPKNPDIWTTGVPDSKITFKIEEILKGDSLKGSIILNGYLSNKDDFNDQAVPYSFVRRGGRSGSCFANTYKQGAQFLLFLKTSDQVNLHGTTPFTVDIDALAPVNEQLHSSDDPWVYYVKGLLEGLKDPAKIGK